MLLKELKEKIIKCRRGNAAKDYLDFKVFLINNIDELLKECNSRWLLSICDTVIDGESTHGFQRELAAQAMNIVVFANTVKLCMTDFILYDVKLNKKKLKERQGVSMELWDGMMAFRPINPRGDVTYNMFRRMNKVVRADFLKKILHEIFHRIENFENPISDLNKYHKKIFETAYES